MTTVAEIVAAKSAQPFRPFTIHLTDGERLTITRAGGGRVSLRQVLATVPDPV